MSESELRKKRMQCCDACEGWGEVIHYQPSKPLLASTPCDRCDGTGMVQVPERLVVEPDSGELVSASEAADGGAEPLSDDEAERIHREAVELWGSL